MLASLFLAQNSLFLSKFEQNRGFLLCHIARCASVIQKTRSYPKFRFMSFYVQRIYHQPISEFGQRTLYQNSGFKPADGGVFFAERHCEIRKF